MTTLYNILEHISKIENILFIVKSDDKSSGAIAEIKSNCLATAPIKQKSKWITLGDNDGPAHMHIDAEQISHAEFVEEVKTPTRTSFSVRFFDSKDRRVLAAFWTKMYDESDAIIESRIKSYTDTRRVYGGPRVKFEKTTDPPV